MNPIEARIRRLEQLFRDVNWKISKAEAKRAQVTQWWQTLNFAVTPPPEGIELVSTPCCGNVPRHLQVWRYDEGSDTYSFIQNIEYVDGSTGTFPFWHRWQGISGAWQTDLACAFDDSWLWRLTISEGATLHVDEVNFSECEEDPTQWSDGADDFLVCYSDPNE